MERSVIIHQSRDIYWNSKMLSKLNTAPQRIWFGELKG